MFEYPEPIDLTCGCKVSWRRYATKQQAEEASKVAAEERSYQLEQGYDFGYQWPGDISKNSDGTYTVVCP
jgi:hypothetical protein